MENDFSTQFRYGEISKKKKKKTIGPFLIFIWHHFYSGIIIILVHIFLVDQYILFGSRIGICSNRAYPINIDLKVDDVQITKKKHAQPSIQMRK